MMRSSAAQEAFYRRRSYDAEARPRTFFRFLVVGYPEDLLVFPLLILLRLRRELRANLRL